MNTKLQIILIVSLIVVLTILIWQVKRKKLDLRYTLSWLLLVFCLFVLVLFPELLSVMTEFLGIVSPINMVFFCGFCFSLVIIYTLTIAISKMADEIRKLAQTIALLEKELKQRKECRKEPEQEK